MSKPILFATPFRFSVIAFNSLLLLVNSTMFNLLSSIIYSSITLKNIVDTGWPCPRSFDYKFCPLTLTDIWVSWSAAFVKAIILFGNCKFFSGFNSFLLAFLFTNRLTVDILHVVSAKKNLIGCWLSFTTTTLAFSYNLLNLFFCAWKKNMSTLFVYSVGSSFLNIGKILSSFQVRGISSSTQIFFIMLCTSCFYLSPPYFMFATTIHCRYYYLFNFIYGWRLGWYSFIYCHWFFVSL